MPDHSFLQTNEIGDVKLAIQIRVLRNAYNMSQSELALRTETSRHTIIRIENADRVMPRTGTLDKLHGIFYSRGAEVSISNDELMIRFTKEALVVCSWGIYGADEVPDKSNNELPPSAKSAVLVRALRNAFAMSQEELAAEAGLSVTTLVKVEKVPGASLRLDTLNTLVNAFKKRGVEITHTDDELYLRFTKEALDCAGNRIRQAAESRKK